jgi:hypothetical protein
MCFFHCATSDDALRVSVPTWPQQTTEYIPLPWWFHWLPSMDIWMSSNGAMPMDVHGIMNSLYQTPPSMDIWMSSNGIMPMDVHGIVNSLY